MQDFSTEKNSEIPICEGGVKSLEKFLSSVSGHDIGCFEKRFEKLLKNIGSIIVSEICQMIGSGCLVREIISFVSECCTMVEAWRAI